MIDMEQCQPFDNAKCRSNHPDGFSNGNTDFSKAAIIVGTDGRALYQVSFFPDHVIRRFMDRRTLIQAAVPYRAGPSPYRVR